MVLHLRHEAICINTAGNGIDRLLRRKILNFLTYRRSRAHALRVQGGEPQQDDDVSLGGSDQDQDQELSSSASSDIVSFVQTFEPIGQAHSKFRCVFRSVEQLRQ